MKKIITLSIVIVSVIGLTLYAQNRDSSSPEDKQLTEWEQLAENGDTAAMHKLIQYLDKNLPVYLDVEEVIEVEPYEEVCEFGDTIISYCDSVVAIDDVLTISPEQTECYAQRLEYWLNKGIALNDPIALYTKGMRLYYEDEAKAIEYLSKAADAGNVQAALFCGSALYNQGQIGRAMKYLRKAYDNEIPSAGWHLAMCIARSSQALNKDLIIEYLRHSANLDYPEAVSEMRRIEPTNPVWQHKADSLNIDIPDFPIIP